MSVIEQLDKFWCGKTQLPASMLYALLNDRITCRKLAFLRINSALCLFAELLGTFLITFGFFSTTPLWILLVGVICKIGGGTLSALFQNYCGALLSIELQKSLRDLKDYHQEIHALLSDKGCSESEINAIGLLPSEIYHTEINSYQRARLLNLGIPIACSLALFLNYDFFTGGAVLSLGLLSFPIGEWFFKSYTFRQEAQLRIGRSAQHTSYIQQLYNDHVLSTVQINFLSQLPLLLFVIKFILSASSQLVASFYGFTQGLMGLTGTLAFQRTRVSALRTIQTSYHLINAVSSNTFLITPQCWNKHIASESSPLNLSRFNLSTNGILFQNFAANILSKNKQVGTLVPLIGFIPRGGIGILQAPSGQGKSTFLLALCHLINHSGDLFFVREGSIINVHDIAKEKLQDSLFSFREESVEKSARLIDLFKLPLTIKLLPLQEQMRQQFGEMLTTLAWKASDNLIEQEISHLEEKQSSVFPPTMYEILKQMRNQRSVLLKEILFQTGGYFVSARIYPERVFITLSSGEKRRLVSTLTWQTAMVKPLELVILDEPFAHLDLNSVQDQLEMIKRIQNLPNPPGILLISHLFIKEAFQSLQDCHIL